MKIDYTTALQEASSKLWAEMNQGQDVAPLEDQSAMVKFSMQSRVLAVMTSIKPVVEQSIKNKLINIINESHELGWSADETLMALTVELSEDE